MHYLELEGGDTQKILRKKQKKKYKKQRICCKLKKFMERF